MRFFFPILLLLLLTGFVNAQTIRVSGPSGPVEAGSPFRIQYIIEAPAAHELVAPGFVSFRIVEGPDIYAGKSANKDFIYRNYIYTLDAEKAGVYTIAPAKLHTGTKTIESSPVKITVVPAGSLNTEPQGVTAYYLKPGEDAAEKVKQNMFLRVSTDKKTCRVGEPVMAIFKLYSRLESRSSILKNPGFYGFTVQDILSVQDHKLTTEMINGLEFDVTIIRKLQLYPLQAGEYQIDPMVLQNKVEFSRTVMNRKTSQQVAEGMLNQEEAEDKPAEGTVTIETELKSEPLTISVKALPVNGKPVSFNGAVGRFRISAVLEKNELKRNEEGELQLSIEGTGNFTQLTPPQIRWPEGIEGFDAIVTDSLDKESIPLKGKRVFRFGFVCTRPGSYSIGPVTFSYFNNDSSRFSELKTPALAFTVSTSVVPADLPAVKNENIDLLNTRSSRLALLIVVVLVVGILAYWIFRKKPEMPVPAEKEAVEPAVEEWLKPAAAALESDQPDTVYSHLLNGCRNWAAYRLGGNSNLLNKSQLSATLTEQGVETELARAFISLIETCETGVYTPALLTDDPGQIITEAAAVLEQMEKQLL